MVIHLGGIHLGRWPFAHLLIYCELWHCSGADARPDGEGPALAPAELAGHAGRKHDRAKIGSRAHTSTRVDGYHVGGPGVV